MFFTGDVLDMESEVRMHYLKIRLGDEMNSRAADEESCDNCRTQSQRLQ